MAAPDILNASVLIVDDQESNIGLIEQLLSEAGYLCIYHRDRLAAANGNKSYRCQHC
jgi:CheY-like chemotaxis protein